MMSGRFCFILRPSNFVFVPIDAFVSVSIFICLLVICKLCYRRVPLTLINFFSKIRGSKIESSVQTILILLFFFSTTYLFQITTRI